MAAFVYLTLDKNGPSRESVAVPRQGRSLASWIDARVSFTSRFRVARSSTIDGITIVDNQLGANCQASARVLTHARTHVRPRDVPSSEDFPSRRAASLDRRGGTSTRNLFFLPPLHVVPPAAATFDPCHRSNVNAARDTSGIK